MQTTKSLRFIEENKIELKKLHPTFKQRADHLKSLLQEAEQADDEDRLYLLEEIEEADEDLLDDLEEQFEDLLENNEEDELTDVEVIDKLYRANKRNLSAEQLKASRYKGNLSQSKIGIGKYWLYKGFYDTKWKIILK